MIETDTATRTVWRIRYLSHDGLHFTSPILDDWQAVQLYWPLIQRAGGSNAEVVEIETTTRTTVLGDIERAELVRDEVAEQWKTPEVESVVTAAREVAQNGMVNSRRCVVASGVTGAAACGRVIMPTGDPLRPYRHVGAVADALDRDHLPQPAGDL